MTAFSIQSIGRNGRMVALAVVLGLGGTAGSVLVVPTYQSVHAASVSMHVHERLLKYGTWETSRRFGDVWVPTVAARWRPYTDGRWIWTDEGWYWQSDEPFGPIVFHYGRWAYDDALGWVWISGDVWAPAWVVWRDDADDIGWAPAPPEADVVVADAWWAFVPVAAIGAINILPDVRPIEENTVIVRNTTIINDTTIVNDQHRPTVHIGNTVVPVNAGPSLASLPKPIAASMKAAKVVPPAKGTIVEARLDPSKGAALKKVAMKRKPDNVGAGSPALANKAAVAAKPQAGGVVGRPVQGKSVAAKPQASGAVKAAKVAGRPVQGKSVTALRRQPVRSVATAKPVPHKNAVVARQQPKRVPAAVKRQPGNAMQVVARRNGATPGAGMPHRSPRSAVVAKRQPAKCNPRDARCKVHG